MTATAVLYAIALVGCAEAFVSTPRAPSSGALLPIRSIARPIQQRMPTLLTSSAALDLVRPALQEEEEEEAVVGRTDAVVCGGGPAGLLSAIMLAKRYPTRTIRVFDRLTEPLSPDDETVWSDVAKFYLIGINTRGVKALQKFDVWEDVAARCVASTGRRTWSPDGPPEGVQRINSDRPYSQIIPRDKLVAVLHGHIRNNYADRIELNYGYEVDSIDFGANSDDPVRLRVSKCDPAGLAPRSPAATGNAEEELCNAEESYLLETDFLIGADGTARTVASRMVQADEEAARKENFLRRWWTQTRSFRITRYVDDNQRVYKSIPIRLPSDWIPDLGYSARTKEVNMEALPADRKGNLGAVVLFKPENEFAQANVDPAATKKALGEWFPQFTTMMDDDAVAAFAKRPASKFPGFRYAGPRLHQGDRTVILGDCAHTVKPYFGLGLNCALEDVKCLNDALDEASDNVGQAVRLFSKQRAAEAKALVKINRELDRPGILGLFSFVFPLVMDSIFYPMAPRLFAPNVFLLFLNDAVTFQGIQRRKRMDRMGQLAIISTVAWTFLFAARMAIRGISRATGQPHRVVVASMAATLVVARLAQKQLAYFTQPGLGPMDVLVKMRKNIAKKTLFGGKKSLEETS